jgi:hypothetical protein
MRRRCSTGGDARGLRASRWCVNLERYDSSFVVA